MTTQNQLHRYSQNQLQEGARADNAPPSISQNQIRESRVRGRRTHSTADAQTRGITRADIHRADNSSALSTTTSALLFTQIYSPALTRHDTQHQSIILIITRAETHASRIDERIDGGNIKQGNAEGRAAQPKLPVLRKSRLGVFAGVSIVATYRL